MIVIRDTPAPGINMAECVSVNNNHLSRCARSRAAIAETKGQAQVEAAQGLQRTTLVDLTDAICPTDRCAPVIGGVLVYRDADHMTATYAASLADRLAARIPKA